MELVRKDNGNEYFNDLLLQYIQQEKNTEVLAILKNANLCQISDNSGNTLLYFAAGYGNAWLARYLIDSGANVDAQNHSKETPLMFAVQNQKKETVKLLLEANAEIFVRDRRGKCALRKAIDITRLLSNTIFRSRNPPAMNLCKLEISRNIVEIIEERVTMESLSRHIDSKVFHVDCPLYLFISMKNVEITRVLLEKGSPANAQEPDTGDTSLHIAVRKVDLQKAKLLLTYGADVHVKNRKGKTPLACLSFYHRWDKGVAILNALMAAGADLIDRDRGEILVKVLLIYEKKEVIRNLLKHVIDLHFMDKDGQSAMHYLAENRDPDVLAELHGYDFCVDIRTRNSKLTMLHCAAYKGNASSVQFLVDRGADVDAICSKGDSPLGRIFVRRHYLQHYLDSYEACVEILLASGADPRIVTEKNYRNHRQWIEQKFTIDFIRLMKPVVIHLSAAEASGREIGNIMGSGFQSNPGLKEVFDSKKTKLEEMKVVKLDKSVTLLDFVVARKKDISLYARNRRIILGSLNSVKEDSFDPRYEHKFRVNVLEFKKLIELRRKSAVVVCSIIGELYNIAIYDVVEKIVDYLEDHELGKLLGTTSRLPINEQIFI